MSLDEHHSRAGTDEDAASALGGEPLKTTDDGGSDVLRKAVDESNAEYALLAKRTLINRLKPHLIGLIEGNRHAFQVTLLLERNKGDVPAAARMVLEENGLPRTMHEMAMQISREGRGVSLNFAPYIHQVIAAVEQHLEIPPADAAETIVDEEGHPGKMAG